MINIVVKPDSEKIGDKWTSAGMIKFPSGSTLTERAERYYEIQFDTKEEADQYFLQASRKKYKIINQN